MIKIKDDQDTLLEIVAVMHDIINHMKDKDQTIEKFFYEEFNSSELLHEIYFENLAQVVYRNLNDYDVKHLTATFLSSLIHYDVYNLPGAFRISYNVLKNLISQRNRNQDVELQGRLDNASII